ncbi:hypothetical protein D3C71_1757150 [compost metagenome]
MGTGVGQGIDFGIAADLENLAILHCYRLDQPLSGFGGEYLAVEQYEIGGGHRLHRG